jgi:hypothetical protein
MSPQIMFPIGLWSAKPLQMANDCAQFFLVFSLENPFPLFGRGPSCGKLLPQTRRVKEFHAFFIISEILLIHWHCFFC